MGSAYKYFVLFSFCLFFVIPSNKCVLLKTKGFLGNPRTNELQNVPEDRWVVQRLDHFNPSNTNTWKQRYFVNSEYYKPQGPVFLMIGGEGEASPKWMKAGQWINYAQKHGAFCVQLEHRYYGKSHPTSDMSTENLQYLSSEQALADLAYFHDYIESTYNITDAKWVAFGGSYPGGLSAWYRAKYPHLVHASIASSAPIYAVLDFKEYLQVVTASLATTGQDCNQQIYNATQQIQAMLQTMQGRQQLKDMFKLCDDLDPNDKNGIANFYETLAGNFEDIVQYNKDNRDFGDKAGTQITIDTLCDIMTNATIGDAVSRYAAVNSLLMTAHGMTACLDVSYANMIKQLQDVSWSSEAASGGRQWIYQTCTEFGYYQSSNYNKQPFGHNIPLSYFVDQCRDIYGDKFTEDFINFSINRTNTVYGGYDLQVSRVLFVNGDIDPWHALSFTKDTPTIPTVFIKGTAHCANMYPSSQADSPELKAARVTIDAHLSKWLNTPK